MSDGEYEIPVLVVVPSTAFNANCPIIVGTNVMRLCKAMVETEEANVSAPAE